MFAILVLCVVVSLSAVRCDNKVNSVAEPITLTVSPKIWNLLKTKANIINATVTSIPFPEFSGQQGPVKYRIWDGKVEHFSMSHLGASFQDIDSGIHVTMKNVTFKASIKGSVEVGKKMFGKWIPFGWMSGTIKANSETAGVDVKLVWKDFKFVPTVSMNSNIRLGFTSSLWMLYFLKGRIERMVTTQINTQVPIKIIEAIELQVNPRLQQLKQKMTSMGYDHYDIEWTVQNNTLRVVLKPKSAKGVVLPIQAIDNMLCVKVNMLTMINEASKRLKRSAVENTKGIDFTCVAPNFKCKGTSCSVCTDVDINPASPGSMDEFHNCIPPL